jgi:hypothetical protein
MASESGFHSREGKEFVSNSPAFTTGSAAHLCKRNRDFCLGLKWPGCEADHTLQKTLPSGLNCVAFYLHFTLRLHDAVLIKHRDILNFVVYAKLQNIYQNKWLLGSVQFYKSLCEFTDTNLMEFEPADAFLYLDSPRE